MSCDHFERVTANRFTVSYGMRMREATKLQMFTSEPRLQMSISGLRSRHRRHHCRWHFMGSQARLLGNHVKWRSTTTTATKSGAQKGSRQVRRKTCTIPPFHCLSSCLHFIARLTLAWTRAASVRHLHQTLEQQVHRLVQVAPIWRLMNDKEINSVASADWWPQCVSGSA